jgi:dTDP-4-amino-4,6-dideoxygalactose transaminase
MNQQISLFKVHMPQSVAKPLLETLFSGFIGQGAKVEEFEESLRNYIGNPYPLTLNSGTAGLHLALRLANVGSGDEVNIGAFFGATFIFAVCRRYSHI